MVWQEWSKVLGRRAAKRERVYRAEADLRSAVRLQWTDMDKRANEDDSQSQEAHSPVSSSTRLPPNALTEEASSSSTPKKVKWHSAELPTDLLLTVWNVDVLNTFIDVSTRGGAQNRERRRCHSCPARLDGSGIFGNFGPCQCVECCKKQGGQLEEAFSPCAAVEEVPKAIQQMRFMEGTWMDDAGSTYVVEVPNQQSRWCVVRSGMGGKLQKRDARLRVVLPKADRVARLQWGPRYTLCIPDIDCDHVDWLQLDGPALAWHRPRVQAAALQQICESDEEHEQPERSRGDNGHEIQPEVDCCRLERPEVIVTTVDDACDGCGGPAPPLPIGKKAKKSRKRKKATPAATTSGVEDAEAARTDSTLQQCTSIARCSARATGCRTGLQASTWPQTRPGRRRVSAVIEAPAFIGGSAGIGSFGAGLTLHACGY